MTDEEVFELNEWIVAEGLKTAYRDMVKATTKNLLAQELAKSTPDAINPFGGPFANSTEQ